MNSTTMLRTILSIFIAIIIFSSCAPADPPVLTGSWRLDSAVMVTAERSLQNKEQANSVWHFNADGSLPIGYANGNKDTAGYKVDTVDKVPRIRFTNIETIYPEMDIIKFTDKELKLQADMTQRSFVLYFTRVKEK